jgi:hypothetical protein
MRTHHASQIEILYMQMKIEIGKKEKGGRPGLPASPLFLFRGIPTSLTEGG